eukprot:gene4574-4828_t
MPLILRQMLAKDGLKVDGTAAGPQNPAQAAANNQLSFVKQELAESCKAAQVAKFKGASPEAEVAAPEAERAGAEAESAGAEAERAGADVEGAVPEAESSTGEKEIDTAIDVAVDGQQWWLDQPKEKKSLNSTNPSAYLSTLAAEMAAARPSAAAAAEPVHPAPINIKVLGGTIKSAVGQVKKRMPGNRNSSTASSILAAVKPAASKAPAKVDTDDVPVTPSFFRRTSSYAAELFGRSSGGAGGSAPGNEPETSSTRQAPAFIKLLRRRSRKTTDC